MRVTVDIPDHLLQLAARQASLEGRTLSALVEDGLHVVLDEALAERPVDVDLPMSKNRGGTLPGVDLTDNAALRDLMDDPRSSPKSD